MKQTISLGILSAGLLLAVSAMGQSIDSTKAKPPTNAFSKYQQSSEFGVPTAPVAVTQQTGHPQPGMIKKLEQKRVQSDYQYVNGRVVGGKTTLHFGKKKD